MASFSAILSSLQDGKEPNISVPRGTVPRSTAPPAGVRGPAATISASTTVGLKRKRQEDGVNDDRATKSSVLPSASAKPSYQGTLKPIANTQVKSAIAKPKQPRVEQQKSSQVALPTSAPSQAKRGFAQLMAKAQAAQEVVKATGPDTIKHKATTLLTKKDRQKMMQEAHSKLEKNKTTNGVGNKALPVRNGAAVRPVKEKIAYAGTMRAKSRSDVPPSKKSKGAAQDKYGGYASWSDLDAEEDEEEGYYNSESDMEEAGFDDMMNEERQAERIAKQEDQQEAEDEERRRKDKLQRKQRLQALSNTAAAKKRF